METKFINSVKDSTFKEVCCMETKEIYDTFLQMYNDGEINNEIENVYIDEDDKKEFFRYIKQKYINCYAIVTFKYFQNPGVLR
jgi:hypothetical protein